MAFAIFAGAIALAAFGVAPIAATALSGAVLLILLRVISADEAYGGLRPEILILIAGMVVIGIAMESSGLAGEASEFLISSVHGLSPLVALIVLYFATMVLTELLSNATVAVLVTPVAVALADSLGVSPRPFLVGVMMAASAAFATPFGYQTNVIVYQMAGYRYTDFVRVGLPLNLLTATVAILAIQAFFRSEPDWIGSFQPKQRQDPLRGERGGSCQGFPRRRRGAEREEDGCGQSAVSTAR
jgi:di/tricarboxylate transporter